MGIFSNKNSREKEQGKLAKSLFTIHKRQICDILDELDETVKLLAIKNDNNIGMISSSQVRFEIRKKRADLMGKINRLLQLIE